MKRVETVLTAPSHQTGKLILFSDYNNIMIYKQGGSLRSPPAAPDLYFPSHRRRKMSKVEGALDIIAHEKFGPRPLFIETTPI